MLLVIHNLPSTTRYADVKALIKDKCGLTEMIVDNLVVDGVGKKVTVGLASEGDAALLVRKINGLYLGNRQLYVEDVRKKKTTEQPYRPNTQSDQYGQEHYNHCPQPQIGDQFYGQPDVMQFQSSSLMSMDAKLTPCVSTPNFGVPFYMTAQNQNVGNNPQFMVEYPKVRGSMGNESYEGRDIGFEQQYGGRKRDRSRSHDRRPNREHSPRRLSRWNEPDRDRSDVSRGRVRPAQRDDRHDADRPYKDNSHGNSFQSRSSNQDYRSKGQNNNRFEKLSNRPEQTWERPDRSAFGESKAPFRFNDNKNGNVQDRRYNEERESQRYKDVNYPQSRGSDNASRVGTFSKKRPYEPTDKNKFVPQTKKFGSNQQFHSKNQQVASASSFSNNYNNKKTVRPSMPLKKPHMQSNRPQMQPKGFQKNKAQWQTNKPGFSNNPPVKYQKKIANFAADRLAPAVSKKLDTTSTEDIARHEAWRVQAAAVIATQILNNLGKVLIRRDPVLLKLKACVRARIDVITGDNMSLNLRDMLSAYRTRFNDDDAFYKAVLAKIKNGEDEELQLKKKEYQSGEVVDKMKNDVKTETPKINFELKSLPSGTQRLPKYPDGNKKMLSQMKKAQKDEALNDSLYNLDPDHEKALNEELDKVEGVIKQELENPENETEKSISQFMNDVFLPDVRKVLTLHVKKRILDIRTNLSVRVICQYKAPKRDVLDAFLKDYGVVSLKASDKNRNILVAICDSYESFDALCKLGSTVIDTLKITFKPLHITGPPIKAKFKKQTTSFIQKRVDNVATTESADQVEMNDASGTQNAGVDSKDNENKIVFDVEEVKENHVSENEILQTNKSESIVVIEDDVLTSKDVIEVDDKEKLDDKNIEVLDEAKSAKVDPEPVINNDVATTNNIDLLTGEDKEIKMDDNKTTVIDDNEVKELNDCELIDNDNIVEDDLEDF